MTGLAHFAIIAIAIVASVVIVDWISVRRRAAKLRAIHDALDIGDIEAAKALWHSPPTHATQFTVPPATQLFNNGRPIPADDLESCEVKALPPQP